MSMVDTGVLAHRYPTIALVFNQHCAPPNSFGFVEPAWRRCGFIWQEGHSRSHAETSHSEPSGRGVDFHCIHLTGVPYKLDKKRHSLRYVVMRSCWASGPLRPTRPHDHIPAIRSVSIVWSTRVRGRWQILQMQCHKSWRVESTKSSQHSMCCFEPMRMQSMSHVSERAWGRSEIHGLGLSGCDE